MPTLQKGEPKLLNSTEVITSLRDLIVQLHRGNAAAAESILCDVSGYLKDAMRCATESDGLDVERTQQTMFAIDEVRQLLAQRDLEGAEDSARDAAKEWRQRPTR